MAIINDFELKNVKEFLGHEEEPLMQGNVYYKGKKVGFWSQDAWGGMDNLNIDYSLPKELRDEVNEKLKTYEGGILFKKIDDLYDKMYNITFPKKLKQIGYEFLFIDLIQLLDHERIYKKYSKMWNRETIYIIYDDIFNTRISTGLKEEDKDKTFFVYNSLNDFNIDMVEDIPQF